MAIAELNITALESPGGAIARDYCKRVPLGQPMERRIVALSTDLAVSVPLDGMTVAVLVVDTGGKLITLRLTNDDNSQQLVEVDDHMTLTCRSKPYTAIDLIRAAGQVATVELLLGQMQTS